MEPGLFKEESPRHEADVPQLDDELSEAVGVHYQTIGCLERGEYSTSLHLALKIAGYFEVPGEVISSTAPFARLGSEQTT